MCAAFGFDPDAFAPTYQLMYGSPGRSLALEIAARLGLPPSIVDRRARSTSAARGAAAEHLARVDHDMRALEHEQAALARERAGAQGRRSASSASARRRSSSARSSSAARSTDRIEDRVREARREIDAVVADLKKRTSVLADRVTRQAAAPRLTTGDAGAARLQAQAAIEEVAERLRAGVDARRPRAPAKPRRAAAGGRRRPGRRRRPRPRRRLVADARTAGGDRRARQADARAESRDLRLAGSGPAGPAAPAQVRVNVNLQPREGLLERAQRDRLHRRRSARAHGAVPRRIARDRSEVACAWFTATERAS